jgi:hypothetical protein
MIRFQDSKIPGFQDSKIPDSMFYSLPSGFWQMPLDEESSYITTFNTPFGRYRFTVVPFGMVIAQEVFHKTVHDKFNDIPGCETDIDDILIWGRTIDEHDLRLEPVAKPAVMQVMQCMTKNFPKNV